MLPDKTAVYRSIEGLIQHFELVMTNRQWKPPVDEVYGATEIAQRRTGLLRGRRRQRRGVPGAARGRRRSSTLPVFPYLIVGHQISDVVAVLGSLNIIAAELDR